MKKPPLFHAGELAVQEKTGEAARAQAVGRAITDSLNPATRSFVETRSMVVASSVSSDGNTWASVVMGEEGFLKPVDLRTIEIDLTRAYRSPHDPLWMNIHSGAGMGLLMIELSTRRRLRVNGEVARATSDRVILDIEETYPNCPKYIQSRHMERLSAETALLTTSPAEGSEISGRTADVVRSADTFFVASVDPAGRADASHRGGRPGFVQVIDDTTLRIPDYPGNSLFNTLGNFAANPRAGLAFLNFSGNALLQMVGQAEIRWDIDGPPDETGGTGRYWDFTIDRWIESALPVRAQWEFIDYSPFNPH